MQNQNPEQFQTHFTWADLSPGINPWPNPMSDEDYRTLCDQGRARYSIFADELRELVKKYTGCCARCTMLADGFRGVVHACSRNYVDLAALRRLAPWLQGLPAARNHPIVPIKMSDEDAGRVSYMGTVMQEVYDCVIAAKATRPPTQFELRSMFF